MQRRLDVGGELVLGTARVGRDDERAVAQRRQVLGHETQAGRSSPPERSDRWPRRRPGAWRAPDQGTSTGAVALPGERIEDHDPRTGHLDRSGQVGHAMVDGRIDQRGGLVRVGPFLLETFQQEA